MCTIQHSWFYPDICAKHSGEFWVSWRVESCLAQGPTVRGPIVRGPNCPGPDLPRTQIESVQNISTEQYKNGICIELSEIHTYCLFFAKSYFSKEAAASVKRIMVPMYVISSDKENKAVSWPIGLSPCWDLKSLFAALIITYPSWGDSALWRGQSQPHPCPAGKVSPDKYYKTDAFLNNAIAIVIAIVISWACLAVRFFSWSTN